MHEALRDAGVITDLNLVSGVDHGFDSSPSYGDLVAYQTAFFLRRTVVEPDRDRIASETLSFAELTAREHASVTAEGGAIEL